MEILYMRTRIYDDEEVDNSILIWNENTLIAEDRFGTIEATQLDINMALRNSAIARIGKLGGFDSDMISQPRRYR